MSLGSPTFCGGCRGRTTGTADWPPWNSWGSWSCTPKTKRYGAGTGKDSDTRVLNWDLNLVYVVLLKQVLVKQLENILNTLNDVLNERYDPTPRLRNIWCLCGAEASSPLVLTAVNSCRSSDRKPPAVWGSCVRPSATRPRGSSSGCSPSSLPAPRMRWSCYTWWRFTRRWRRRGRRRASHPWCRWADVTTWVPVTMVPF